MFRQKRDLVSLGARTLEGFAVTVDSIAHKLVAQATLASISSRGGTGRP